MAVFSGRNTMRRGLCAAFGVALFLGIAHSAPADDAVRFNRDIRPILSDNCFQCHGPDAAKRKAELRLDLESGAKGKDGAGPIVPGKPDESELWRRITSDDPEVRMPPALSGKKLTSAQIETIGRWIAGGANWEKHWSFIPVVRPEVPRVTRAAWVRNPIDAFIAARLEAAGLEPSAETDKTTLLRRVTLDLTGLPPTPAEVDAFLADSSAGAYERVVDRLLDSPRYGERMAAPWLDAARYADTSGYQDDGPRYMWRWRDWVIEAFNRNLPFDRFSIEQIAGDLLPGATLDQRIATGFNRNHRSNAEGGIIPEEYAVEYVVDRVDTTATVWLGLTMGCARCHDHKFDPVTQKEFYRVFAFFNNLPEKGRVQKVGNSPPLVKAPTHDQREKLRAIEARQTDALAAFAALGGELAAGELTWAAAQTPKEPILWAPPEALASHFPLDGAVNDAVEGKQRETKGAVTFDAGMIGSAAALDGASHIEAGDVGKFGYFDKFTFSAWINPRAASGTVLARMAQQPDADGYSVVLADGKLQVNLVKRWLDDALRVETDEPVATDRWQHVAVTYDGTRAAGSVRIFVDGQERKLKTLLDEMNQSFSNAEPLRIGGGGNDAKFKGLIDDVRVYARDLPADEIALLATSDPIDRILAIAPKDRAPRQAAKLSAYYLEEHAPQHIRAARTRIREVRKETFKFEEDFPTVMVMQEMPVRRETFVLARGQYDKPGEKVEPGVPASLHPLPADGPADRLAFARWLVDPANPLTARVAVNRFWQMYFGVGLVKTADDFGAQGDAPSHPDLLDWLAAEFIDGGWDIKQLQKLIVTSAAYRQSSKVTPQHLERDPENRLLARSPRLRLPAEVIRDQALAVSGLLVEQLGGASVKPYQPPGLWKELTGGGDFEQDHGEGLYRRSLYTFWRRTIAPPSMMTFDASAREACSVRETRTNTPLQALALLNEVTFVEAARVLAARVMREAGTSPDERIVRAFRLVTSRTPSDDELAILGGSLLRHLRKFRREPEAAAKLLTVGEAPLDKQLDPAELAAYTAVANVILNLDEVVTKE
jgi:mono/diheme cytochrome c family protein